MNVTKRDWLLSVTAGELLHRPLMNLPSEAQWTLFWRLRAYMWVNIATMRG